MNVDTVQIGGGVHIGDAKQVCTVMYFHTCAEKCTCKSLCVKYVYKLKSIFNYECLCTFFMAL